MRTPAERVRWSHGRAAHVERRVLRLAFRPPPRMSVDEWADSFRHLSPEASAEPGRFSTERAPYQREPMRALSDPRVRTVVLMWPSQIGKTELLVNFVGHRIHLNPGPILVLQPTLTMAEAWSKDRLATMLRDTPALRGRVKDARSRDSDNVILHKRFAGGSITIVGANSPAGLASRPIRDVLADEVDRYPLSAGSEGDPLGLADRRASTFRNGKRLRISTPTIKGASRIEAEYEASTQEKWLVPCPHCEEYQVLLWGGRDTPYGIKWDAGEPDTAHYVCRHCAAVIEDAHKGWMNARGKWVADNPGHPTRGFWTNAIISPWVPWRDVVREFLEVKADPIRLRQFVNTTLCETWEDNGSSVDAGSLAARREAYPCDCAVHDPFGCTTRKVPAGVAVLVRTADPQGDRIETAVWGFGAGEEAWLVDHEIVPGDPGTQAPWTVLAQRIAQAYRHASGIELRPAVTFIDSGGHHTKEVYQFCRARVHQRVFAIKGANTEGAPLLGRPTRNNSARALLYMVGAFTGKESALARLTKVREPGPGYVHLPDWLDGEQVSQFGNEKLVTRIVGGRAKREWVKTGRNEMIDLLVYAYAALHSLGPKTVQALGDIAAKLNARVAPATPAAGESEAPPRPQQRAPSHQRKNWITGW